MDVNSIISSNINYRQKYLERKKAEQRFYEFKPVNNPVISFLGKKDYTENEGKYFRFKKQLSRKFHKLVKNFEEACWNFYINSSKEHEQKYSKAFENYLKTSADPKVLEKLQEMKAKGISDANLQESIDELIKDYTKTVINAEEIQQLEDRQNKIASKFNGCRGEINGKPCSNAELGKMLENEKDVELRKKIYYERSVKAPNLIADDLIELIRKRNEFAQKNGYKDFFSYQLKEAYKTDEEKLFKLLDQLEEQASEIYKRLSSSSRKKLANAFKIKPEDLRPHHYGLILEGDPQKLADPFVKDNDMMVKTALSMYKRMGWDISKLPIHLDLFPKENKNQHGFCFDIDTNKDVRILANLRNNIDSIETLNHELGHAVYDIGISEHLPYFKREVASSAFTEAIAMLMQSLPYREGSFIEDIGIPKKLAAKLDQHRLKDLVSFVLSYVADIKFEKELYANPNQDIQKLWYGLEKKYLNRNIPEVLDNRWASVPHFLSHPAYLQNYLRAEIMAAQIYEAAAEKLGPLTKNKHTAEFFRKQIFRLGKTLTEDEIIKKVTGKELNAEAFLRQIKDAAKHIR